MSSNDVHVTLENTNNEFLRALVLQIIDTFNQNCVKGKFTPNINLRNFTIVEPSHSSLINISPLSLLLEILG